MRARKSAEERKSEIAEAALRLADKHGPDRLTTEQVARAVGLTQAAIFRHFPKKHGLWEAVAARIGEKLQQRWVAAENASPDPLDRLRGLVLGQLRLIQSMPAIPAILFSRELHVENKLLRTVFRELMGQLHRRIEGLVDAGQRQGRLRCDMDAGDAAFLVIGLVQGLVLRWSLSGRDFDLAAEGGRLLEVQLGSLGAAPDSGEARPSRERPAE
jgi:AcrR family transcriptional regulator